MENQLLSVTEAKKRLLSYFSLVDPEDVDLARSQGKILARPVVAPFDMPSFANSSMDGFAVNTADIQSASKDNPAVLDVEGDIPAGLFPTKGLTPGRCMRIMTGAPMPSGANAVVPLEAVEYQPNGPGDPHQGFIRMFSPVADGDYVRPVGMDFHQGDMLIPKGVRLRPQEIGLLAMVGIQRVRVYRPLKIALFSTGSELTPLGEPLQPGKIYDANSFSLGTLISQYGADLIHLGIVRDSVKDVKDYLDEAVKLRVDLIVSSAGVSVGEFDFVREVLEEEGELAFWRVNMRPGKPLAFGIYHHIPLVGLPGNPVSAFVGFEVFVRPVILFMSGEKYIDRERYRVRLEEPVSSDGRESYLRARVSLKDGRYYARLTGHQGSGNLFALAQSNAFLIVPSEVKSLPIGAEVDAWLYGPADFN